MPDGVFRASAILIRFGSYADIPGGLRDVRFTPKSGQYNTLRFGLPWAIFKPMHCSVVTRGQHTRTSASTRYKKDRTVRIFQDCGSHLPEKERLAGGTAYPQHDQVILSKTRLP